VADVLAGRARSSSMRTLMAIANALGADYEFQLQPSPQTLTTRMQAIERQMSELRERLDTLEAHIYENLLGHTHD
jgi:hypothetical protein